MAAVAAAVALVGAVAGAAWAQVAVTEAVVAKEVERPVVEVVFEAAAAKTVKAAGLGWVVAAVAVGLEAEDEVAERVAAADTVGVEEMGTVAEVEAALGVGLGMVAAVVGLEVALGLAGAGVEAVEEAVAGLARVAGTDDGYSRTP